MDAAYLSALSALSGSAIGALASLTSTWLTQRYQDRSQRLTQERARRERIFGELIEQASQLYADALSHTSLEDPARLVPLYATIGKLRLFASARTVAAADAVMERIVETYSLPNLDFTEACRAELRG